MVADKLNNIVSFQYAPVAQLDRVLGYEPSGQRFESSRVRHLLFYFQVKYSVQLIRLSLQITY